MKKIISCMLSICLLLSLTIPAFATESEQNVSTDQATIVIDFDSIDMSQPYEIEKHYTNDQGQPVTIGVKYTPNKDYNPNLRWSSPETASVGVWNAYYNGFIIDGMSYDFDVSRSGSHWKISNARNFTAYCILSTVRDKTLTINRAISTTTYDAEVMGICTIDFLDTALGHLVSLDAWLKATISDDGRMMFSGN